MATALLLGLALLQTPVIAQGPIYLGDRWVIYVDTEIAGERYKMLFDTGSDSTILNPAAYQRVTGETLTEEQKREGIWSKGEYDFRAGAALVGKSHVATKDLSVFKESLGGLGLFDGMIGRDLIGQRVWYIDYLNKSFKVLPTDVSHKDLIMMGAKVGHMGSSRSDAYHRDEWRTYVRTPKGETGIMVDTAASQTALPPSILKELTAYKIGKTKVIRPTGEEERNEYLVQGFFVGNSPWVWHPVQEHEEDQGGVIAPYDMNIRAIAFLPGRVVMHWTSVIRRDEIRTRGLRRITGLPLEYREGKVFVRTGLPEDEGQEREVVSIRGRSPEQVRAMLENDDDPVSLDVALLYAKAGESCELDIQRPDGVAKVTMRAAHR